MGKEFDPLRAQVWFEGTQMIGPLVDVQSAGQHTVSATLWESGQWGPSTVTVKAGETFTQKLLC